MNVHTMPAAKSPKGSSRRAFLSHVSGAVAATIAVGADPVAPATTAQENNAEEFGHSGNSSRARAPSDVSTIASRLRRPN